ncbi:glycoside hydrolase family 3 protein [Auriculariales sp. MPI-PUGE-AT-0066]|nr:glycoside hydrolase family 3 protein [Auriculariales sp. MPI-PUGE-AT-0066]
MEETQVSNARIAALPENVVVASVESKIDPLDFDAQWDAAFKKAKAKVAQWSLDEKTSVTNGASGRCSGNIAPVAPGTSRAWPGLCLEDGPLAMRPDTMTTVFPSGMNAAATFNKDLMRARGVAMGEEFVGKGVNIALSPTANMIRVPTGGRNWESFGADPFLAGEATYETVVGMQSTGIQCQVKHFLANDQEYARFSYSADIDERTTHEVWLHPFMRAVQGGVASVMSSLNRYNGEYASSNGALLNGLLRDDLGFRGFVGSDWQATRNTTDALAGLDMSLPGSAAIPQIPLQNSIAAVLPGSFFGPNLTEAVQQGKIKESVVTDMAERIVAAWYYKGQDSASYPKVNYNTVNKTDPLTNTHTDVRKNHASVARQVAAAGHVLLKNTNSALPLSKTKLTNGLAIVGSDARPPTNITLLGLYVGGLNNGVLVTGYGSGAATLTSLTSPSDAFAARAQNDGTSISYAFDDFNIQSAVAAATGKSAAIVFVKTISGEAYLVPTLETDDQGLGNNHGDRRNLSAWNGGDALIKAVASVNKNTIVVAHATSQMDVEQFIDNPNVTAVIWAGVQGQEVGNALVDIIYGDVNPSGRLPFTIAKKNSDYPAWANRDGAVNDHYSIPYSEKLLVDYRWFDAKSITPRFEFGYGLSYTTFTYSSFAWSLVSDFNVWNLESLLWRTGFGVSQTTDKWMHTPFIRVAFTLKNTGKVAGTEIPQLYLAHPSSAGEPPRVLKGFEAVALKAGESKLVTMDLTPHALSYWDTKSKGWRRSVGAIGVNIGSSSRNFKLTGRIVYL